MALDADTGKLRWHFQFMPNNPYDFDATQIPVLVDRDWNGRLRSLMLWANRNGFYYVLDRTTGEFLFGKPFVKINWASGLDKRGHPLRIPLREGTPVFPGVAGATNWYSPSFSPRTGLFYISVWEDYSSTFTSTRAEYKAGQGFVGGFPSSPVPGVNNPGMTYPGPINTYTEALARGSVIALDPCTGIRKWEFRMHDVIRSGILATGSDLVFVGSREGYFHALDARTGKPLWRSSLGADIVMGPITYAVGGKQYLVSFRQTCVTAVSLGCYFHSVAEGDCS